MSNAVMIHPVKAQDWYEEATSFDMSTSLVRLPLRYDRNNSDQPWQVVSADDMEEGEGTDGYVIEVLDWAGIYLVQPFSDAAMYGYGKSEPIEVKIVGLIDNLDRWVGKHGDV